VERAWLLNGPQATVFTCSNRPRVAWHHFESPAGYAGSPGGCG
jgi:hypothetical protein